MSHYDTTLYEIRYNSCSHMFDVFFQGARIDDLLPCYSDGETSIRIHADLMRANDEACETPMQSAARQALACYPNAAIGRWEDYTPKVKLAAPYAIIAITGYGYAVHAVRSDGTLGNLLAKFLLVADVLERAA